MDSFRQEKVHSVKFTITQFGLLWLSNLLIFEFDQNDADLQRSKVFYSVRRQWLRPLGTRDLRQFCRVAAVE